VGTGQKFLANSKIDAAIEGNAADLKPIGLYGVQAISAARGGSESSFSYAADRARFASIHRVSVLALRRSAPRHRSPCWGPIFAYRHAPRTAVAGADNGGKKIDEKKII
jgi:hypothetical protein